MLYKNTDNTILFKNASFTIDVMTSPTELKTESITSQDPFELFEYIFSKFTPDQINQLEKDRDRILNLIEMVHLAKS